MRVVHVYKADGDEVRVIVYDEDLDHDGLVFMPIPMDATSVTLYCSKLRAFPAFLDSVRVVVIVGPNRCTHLKQLPRDLRELTLLECDALVRVPDELPLGIEFVTLGHLKSLKRFPAIPYATKHVEIRAGVDFHIVPYALPSRCALHFNSRSLTPDSLIHVAKMISCVRHWTYSERIRPRYLQLNLRLRVTEYALAFRTRYVVLRTFVLIKKKRKCVRLEFSDDLVQYVAEFLTDDY